MRGRFYYTSMDTGSLVAFFDSGIGGLPYLRWLREHHDRVECTYLADRMHFPYGQKSPEELLPLILDVMERYIRTVEPDVVVVACNTASVTALGALRERFAIPFVGVVPAIKPAASLTSTGEIGLLATRRTVEDPYTDNLVRLFAGTHRVRRYAGVDIIDFVENRLLDASPGEVEQILEKGAAWFSSTRIDTLVLGCTHFLHVRDEIARILGDGIRIVDSLEGVGRQVLRLIDALESPERTISNPHKSQDHGIYRRRGSDRFYLTGPVENEETYRRFAQAFELSWGGFLP